MIPATQARVGSTIIINGSPYEVMSATHINMGRGQAKIPVKLRNLLTGSIVEQTFQGGDRVEEAEIRHRHGQFLYAEAGQAHIMLNDSYEQVTFAVDRKQLDFLKEGAEVTIKFWQESSIGISIPKKVELKVTYTEPGNRGDSTGDPKKPAELETGATVQVPLFIKPGDLIRINTESGEYDSRA